MQPPAMNRQHNKDRYDCWSIPGYVINKNRSRGTRHGQSLRQIMYHKARVMLRRAKLPKEWFVRNYSGKMVHTDADYQK